MSFCSETQVPEYALKEGYLGMSACCTGYPATLKMRNTNVDDAYSNATAVAGMFHSAEIAKPLLFCCCLVADRMVV